MDSRTLSEVAQAYWEKATPQMRHERGRGGTLFRDIGASSVRRLKQAGFERFGGVLEWGCGGGANAVALAGLCKWYYGVDVSRASLDACESEMRGKEVCFDTILVSTSDDPRNVLPLSFGVYDLFICTHVIQHMHDRDYARAVTREGLAGLGPNGVALLQTRRGPAVGAVPYEQGVCSWLTYSEAQVRGHLLPPTARVLLHEYEAEHRSDFWVVAR